MQPKYLQQICQNKNLLYLKLDKSKKKNNMENKRDVKVV